MFDMNKYQALALRTESPVNHEMEERLMQAYPLLYVALKDAIYLGRDADKYKRHIFYGKPNPEFLEAIKVNEKAYPPKKDLERIRQCTRLLHALVGLLGEVGEALEKVHDYIHDTPDGAMNSADMIEEGGDLVWYTNLYLACFQADIPTTARANIAKLQERYKDKFTVEEAIERDTGKEMAAHNEMFDEKNKQHQSPG